MSQVVIDRLKNEIREWSIKHSQAGDDELSFAEDCEMNAEMCILKYCLQNNYTVRGFAPTPLDEEEDVEDLIEYLGKLRLFLDLLCLEKDDVAELCHYYQSTFWPELSETVQDMIARIQRQVNSGKFYEVDL